MEIGKINLETDQIVVNDDVHVNYSCEMDGKCCKRFHIPVTDFDIKRIEDKGYELDQIIQDKAAFFRMPKNEFGSVEKNYHMKRKPFDNSCTFLEKGKCSIHEFKPFGCRIFPFQFIFQENSVVKVTIHESNFCPSVTAVSEKSSQNKEFLIYLRDILKNEMNYRQNYRDKFGKK